MRLATREALAQETGSQGGVRDGVESLGYVDDGHHPAGARFHAAQGFSQQADVGLAAIPGGEPRLPPGESMCRRSLPSMKPVKR